MKLWARLIGTLFVTCVTWLTVYILVLAEAREYTRIPMAAPAATPMHMLADCDAIAKRTCRRRRKIATCQQPPSPQKKSCGEPRPSTGSKEIWFSLGVGRRCVCARVRNCGKKTFIPPLGLTKSPCDLPPPIWTHPPRRNSAEG